MGAWWSGSCRQFLATGSEEIIGALSTRLVETHPLNRAEQVRAWRDTVAILRTALSDCPPNWQVLLEYPLLRLQRRIDVVLLTEHAILVLEFKSRNLSLAAKRQAEDYALDLFDFHGASRGHPLVPIVVAEDEPQFPIWPLIWHGIAGVLEANPTTLPRLLHQITTCIPASAQILDPLAWEGAAYRPVPTIVEAARMLYARHGVDEIAAARADAGNLTRTKTAIQSAIQHARETSAHIVLFVTGIPGAGKTLCGLNAVFGADGGGAAFLTGNIPLVHVLREALARDAAAQEGSLRMARQRAKSAIQPLNGFLKEALSRSDAPHEHVIVFDEAQRAWDADFGRRKFRHNDSEAGLFLDIMSRHHDWGVIIALVGTGQEINTGEAGLEAWGQALLLRPKWRVYAPSNVLAGSDPRQRLFASAPPGLTLDSRLNLSVPVRAIRSQAAAPWVDAVLSGRADSAIQIATEAGGVPFLITRSLDALRQKLRNLARGTRRAGLVCSAGARRLIADGIWPNFDHLDSDAVANWFLRSWPDVRASDALELPATQFACQGLELDYVGLCWGNDLLRIPGRPSWLARDFAGSRWNVARAEASVAYHVNTYRVLLTRARYETVIWIPRGAAGDPTRDPKEFDAIAEFLGACGAMPLEQVEPYSSEAEAEPEPTLL